MYEDDYLDSAYEEQFEITEPYEDDLSNWEDEQVFQDIVLEQRAEESGWCVVCKFPIQPDDTSEDPDMCAGCYATEQDYYHQVANGEME